MRKYFHTEWGDRLTKDRWCKLDRVTKMNRTQEKRRLKQTLGQRYFTCCIWNVQTCTFAVRRGAAVRLSEGWFTDSDKCAISGHQRTNFIFACTGSIVYVDGSQPWKHISDLTYCNVELSGTVTHALMGTQVAWYHFPLECDVLLEGETIMKYSHFLSCKFFDPYRQVFVIRRHMTSPSLLFLKTRRVTALGPCRYAPDEEVCRFFNLKGVQSIHKIKHG